MLDIGTGDGRFVSASAKANPDRFYIGIDANAKPLEKLSTKITRKPAKGGLPNAMFVQAAVEDLPCEFDAIANEIHINFPWGSLLRAVAVADEKILESLHRVAAADAQLTITIGVDPDRDRSELERLGVPDLCDGYLRGTLLGRYAAAGFRNLELRELPEGEWSRLDTSWARRLGGNSLRKVHLMKFRCGKRAI